MNVNVIEMMKTSLHINDFFILYLSLFSLHAMLCTLMLSYRMDVLLYL